MKRNPKIAILRWEQGLVPEGLKQLDALPGNSTNPASYPFPVRLVPVDGACVETVITNPSQKLLEDMIAISKKLIAEEGIKGIATSCGFNAVFQKQMAEALDVPVFSSSLMQVPFVQNVIGRDKTVAVITANKSALTKVHFEACGIGEDINYEVYGLEDAKEWSKIFDKPDERFDIELVEQEIVDTARAAVKGNPDIGAIVLECTDLPPFAKKISKAVNLPVFDFNSMMGYMAVVLGEINLYESR